MKTDILNKPQTVKIDSKDYKFIYDYETLSELETIFGLGVYQIYDLLMSKKGLTLDESVKVLKCSLMRNHTSEEIEELESKIKEHPGIWLKVKEAVIASFILPLMPPEILEKTVIKPKKKTK